MDVLPIEKRQVWLIPATTITAEDEFDVPAVD
jgi:hypothetical protein